MQATGNHHSQIGKSTFGISQYIFDNARAFDACQRMFYTHADARDALILAFISSA